jgi:hypothetical protein
LGFILVLYSWAVLVYSRIVPAPKDKTTETRKYFAKIGIHID